ncbi:MAG: NAD(P)H-hydrate dehydratase [Chitinispirillaceae bacterium]|jgi:NAD(P)H-hydrate epimerase|nr:NAD(P)H-hydrate dehydratase [Chitinispirillaceae bacterium]
MIPVMTVAQMRSIDSAAIAGNTATGYSYMKKAGEGLFRAVLKMAPDTRSGPIAVVCGKGNNGGDGYAAARLLHDAGYCVECFSLCDTGALTGEARLAYHDYYENKGRVRHLDSADLLPDLTSCQLIIDALLGTGTRGDPQDLYAAMIDAINQSGVLVLAVDTPSGLNCDTGVPGTPCIRASATVTMGFPKIGQYCYPGRELVGTLIVHDLAYPDAIVSAKSGKIFVPDANAFSAILPARKPSGSKYDHGLALLVCGSRGMTGSATLVAEAAMRTGCGMTHLAAPESIIPILCTKLTETVMHPVAEGMPAGIPTVKQGATILALSEQMHAMAVGPGLSHHPESTALVRALVASSGIPVVLDADGINAYKDRVQELRDHAGCLVITPHRGEWQRLFGELPADPAAIIDMLRDKARDFRMTILLKGSPTICVDPEGDGYLLPYGNSALAKAGTGDVLTGIIVSLMAQGASCTHAALLGAYIHGEAGNAASEKYGEYSVIASDVVSSIYRVMKKFR